MSTRFGHDLLRRLTTEVVGRRRELEVIIAALAAGRHLLLEGPPGTGKSTVLRSIASAADAGYEFVEGNAELTPARLVGSFDPAAALAEGYVPDAFLDGPLLTAMREGSLLYVEEINRIPEETLNVLITVMSEGELGVPRLGRVTAADGFRLVAAMNPFDAVGTARIASAVYDRCCRLAMDYQSADDEVSIVTLAAKAAAASVGDAGVLAAVATVRDTRSHPDVRTGSSVRGAIDLVLIAHELASLRERSPFSADVTLDAAQLALSGRIRVREAGSRTAEDIVHELWLRHLAPLADDAGADPTDGAAHEAGGHSPQAPPGGGRGPEGDVLEGDAAREAVATAGRRTVSRRDLSRHERFDQVSSEVGVLDDDAFGSLLDDDPDEALALLADLNGASDERLRALAHRLSARVIVDLARTPSATARRAVGHIERVRSDHGAGDIDLDASLDAIVDARRGGVARSDDLVVESWRRADTAVCLLVDRSGSMSGERLATAAVAAAAVAIRAGHDCSVVAFARDAIVLGSPADVRPPADIVVDLCRLRGFGTTDLGLALRVAARQLAGSRAGRRLTILLSDCRTTSGGDPYDDARALDELVVLTPGDDTADAEAFARAAGVRWAPLHGPSSVPDALDQLLRGAA